MVHSWLRIILTVAGFWQRRVSFLYTCGPLLLYKTPAEAAHPRVQEWTEL